MQPTVDPRYAWLAAFADELTRLRPSIDPKALLMSSKEAFAQFGAEWTPQEAAHLWIVPGDPVQTAPDDLNY